MQQPAINIKESLHQIADQLPEGATWKDVVYEAYTRQEIENGLLLFCTINFKLLK